jgi:hypothetical protein
MPRFKYTGDPRYRSRPTGDLTTDDTATVDDGDAAHFDDHDDFERVSEGESGGSDDEDGAAERDLPDGASGTLPFNPEDHTNDEIEERAADIDDPEAVRALRNLEAEQKNRNGALDALDSRVDDLTDGDEE